MLTLRPAPLLIALVLVWLAAIASLAGQTPPPTAIVSWEIEFFMPGVDPAKGAPFTSLTIPRTAVTCAKAATPPMAATVNPRTVSWAGDPGERCVADSAAFLQALPLGGDYLGTAIAVTAASLRSPRSAPSNPFSRLADPAAPTELRFTR